MSDFAISSTITFPTSKWLAANGEAIYDSSYGFPTGIDQVVATRRGDTAYLIVVSEPGNLKLVLPAPYRRYTKVTMLESGKAVEFGQSGEGIEVALPDGLSYQQPVVIKLE